MPDVWKNAQQSVSGLMYLEGYIGFRFYRVCVSSILNKPGTMRAALEILDAAVNSISSISAHQVTAKSVALSLVHRV